MNGSFRPRYQVLGARRASAPTNTYPDQDKSKSNPSPKTAFQAFFPRTSDYPAKNHVSLTADPAKKSRSPEQANYT